MSSSSGECPYDRNDPRVALGMQLGWSKFQPQIEGVHYQPGGGAINMIHADGSKGYDKEAFEWAVEQCYKQYNAGKEWIAL